MGISSVRRRYRRYYRDPTTDTRLPPKKKPPDRNPRTTGPNYARQISRLECRIKRRQVRRLLENRRGPARIKAGKRAPSLPWYKDRARANQRHDFYFPIGTTPLQQTLIRNIRMPIKQLHPNGFFAFAQSAIMHLLLLSYLPKGFIHMTQFMQFVKFLTNDLQTPHLTYALDLPRIPERIYDFASYLPVIGLIVPLIILIVFCIRLRTQHQLSSKLHAHRQTQLKLQHSIF
mmetsp:Transcript_17455/g.29574  ORF Transcript_17455/g.29574 Transcript_17455/m.29574 type:complete len:231 (+) Transcript_17455:164-856(+)